MPELPVAAAVQVKTGARAYLEKKYPTQPATVARMGSVVTSLVPIFLDLIQRSDCCGMSPENAFLLAESGDWRAKAFLNRKAAQSMRIGKRRGLLGGFNREELKDLRASLPQGAYAAMAAMHEED